MVETKSKLLKLALEKGEKAIALKIMLWYNSVGQDAKTYPEEKEVNKMKADIQPKYFEAKVKCNCGNEFITGSTKPEIKVEICSKCHPFYTGTQKQITDAGGQVEKFNRRFAKASK